MQRIIKFRGKRVDNGEWVYGYYVFKKEYNKQFILEYIIGSEIDYTIEREVDPATVGQFTGHTDKNGKEIYEGDVVKFTTKLGEHIDPLPVEISPKYGARPYLKGYGAFEGWFPLQSEVISNIYENPELCKG